MQRLAAQTLLLGLILFGPGSAPARAQAEQVVLLRNGTTLKGKVVQEGNYIYVALPRGEIQLRSDQVERICNSLEECFRYRLAQLLPGDVHGQLELAQWCVDEGLIRQAQWLLDQVRRTASGHPRLELLQRRLRLLSQGASIAKRGLPSDSFSPARKARHSPPLAPIGTLPPEAVEQFTVSVHRILQNRCASGSCHGGGRKGGFGLIRASRGRVSPRVVRHNLASVLRWVNQAQVERSLLLKMALTPHGSTGLYQFNGLDKHTARTLRRWLEKLAQPPAGSPSPSQNPHLPKPSAASNQGKQAPPSVPSQKSTQRTTPVGYRNKEAPHAGASGSATTTSPYDPQVFNRRFHPQRRSLEPNSRQKNSLLKPSRADVAQKPQ